MRKRSLVGIIFIVLGVGFLLGQLGMFDFGYYFRLFWPAIFILIGLIQMVETKSVTGPAILILIGVGLIINNLNISINFWNFFWPALLILIGLSILFDRNRYYIRHEHTSDGPTSTFSSNAHMTDDSHIDSFCMFGGSHNKNVSRSFQGGTVTAIFGGATIDLRDSVLSPDGAVIDAFAAFGGVDIFVPMGWKVIVKGVPIFGGCENKTMQNPVTDPNAPALTINYFAAFGAVDIKN